MEDFNSLDKLFQVVDLEELRNFIIPEINKNWEKGDNGVIAVVGGSFEYTGAPYYSAISALKAGCDLSHIFCYYEAATPIKCYTPELIVHPAFDNNPENEELLNKTVRWFQSMDCLVYGPGLGREESTFKIFNYFLNESLKIDYLTHILDADSLWHIMNLDIEKLQINSNSNIIITPNKREFNRLYKKFISSEENEFPEIDEFLVTNNLLNKDIVLINDMKTNFIQREVSLAKILNVIVVCKGRIDVITDGNIAFIVSNKGSKKRCGGIGDILDGIIATFCTMLKKKIKQEFKKQPDKVETMKAIAFACLICRKSAYEASKKNGYSLTAPDVVKELSSIAKDY